MPNLLFPRDKIIGVFRGFTEGGLEFHADLVLPYQSNFQNMPMHGQFLLVQLETDSEAVLGRITSLSSAGKLSSGTGEEFNIRAVREDRPIPEDLREQYLKYNVNIRVLGLLRKDKSNKILFVPSHRRLPHVGSPVAFLPDEVLREVAGQNAPGVPIGFYALGEYIFAAENDLLSQEPWMKVSSPSVITNFDVSNLVSRRSFVFARAGFGKSNLTKLLFSKLYEKNPTVTKRGGVEAPVGTLIFDPEGEYFWPDDKGRPGLCDVPDLQDKLVVFTSRKAPSDFYQSFVAGGIKLDIRRLNPSDVIAIALSPEKQDQQNVRKLKGLRSDNWVELVDLVDKDGNQSDLSEIKRIVGLESGQDAEALAARANMTSIVKMIHSRSSQLLDMLLQVLADGKLCVVDVSQMRGGQSLILSGIILQKIFDRNQTEFTKADPKAIPTIAVIEEAQTVLNEGATSAEPFISWVKEGRKYDLGAVLITQQPGSIPAEILSQGDNWFIFHLLAAGDLKTIKAANAHFSEDILSSLLNEPLPGQGVFWSSSSGRPYPIYVRILSFEKIYDVIDSDFKMESVNNYAASLKRDFNTNLAHASQLGIEQIVGKTQVESSDNEDIEPLDVLKTYEEAAIRMLEQAQGVLVRIRTSGVAWGELNKILAEAIPDTVEDKPGFAYRTVPKALTKIFGAQGTGWKTVKKDGKTYVKSVD